MLGEQQLRSSPIEPDRSLLGPAHAIGGGVHGYVRHQPQRGMGAGMGNARIGIVERVASVRGSGHHPTRVSAKRHANGHDVQSCVFRLLRDARSVVWPPRLGVGHNARSDVDAVDVIGIVRLFVLYRPSLFTPWPRLG